MYASCGGAGSWPARRNDVERPELAGLDQPTGLAVARVEAPLEAELERHAAALDLGGDRDRVVEVDRERLLAEGRQAAPDRRADQLGVGRGRGGDDDRVGASMASSMVAARGAPTSAATSAARSGICVGDEQLVDAGCRDEEPGMHPPDATGADEGDPHRDAEAMASPSTRMAVASLSLTGLHGGWVIDYPERRRIASVRTAMSTRIAWPERRRHHVILGHPVDHRNGGSG